MAEDCKYAYYNSLPKAGVEMQRLTSSLLEQGDSVCVDFEWDSHDRSCPLSLIQVAHAGCTHVFDAVEVPSVLQAFTACLQSPTLTRVLHDARMDCRMLSGHGVKVGAPLFDTQVAHSVLRGEEQRGLAHVAKAWLGVDLEKKKNKVVKKFMRTPHAWVKRPLPPNLLKYAAGDVAYLPQLYQKMKEEAIAAGALGEILDESYARTSKQAKSKALKATAVAFIAYITSSPELQRKAEDLETLKQEIFPKWKEEEKLAGRPHRVGTATQVVHKLVGMGRVCVQRNAVAFMNVGERKTARAKLREVAERVEANRAAIEADKGGVEVTMDAFQPSVRPNETAEARVRVRLTGSGDVMLREAMMLRRTFSVDPLTALPVTLRPGVSLQLVVRCTPRYVGVSADTLTLDFQGVRGAFSIGRFLKLSCGNFDHLAELQPTAPYKKRVLRRPKPVPDKLKIQPPPDNEASEAPVTPRYLVGLPRHNVPLKWVHMPYEEKEQELASQAGLLEAATDDDIRAKYVSLYKLLLFCEELQLIADLQSFDLADERAIDLTFKGGGLLAVHVKGLAENRPSVLKGDKLHVSRQGEKILYVGIAHAIHQEDVLLRLDPRFTQSYVQGEKVDVRFVLSRTPLRLFHEGLSLVAKLEQSFLFPPSPLPLCERRPAPTRFFNAAISSNDDQREAVRRIVEGEGRRAPYVIFGPPGTGKTVTLVEAIRQCLSLRDNFKVLVCAPTNTAADLLCERLSPGLADKMHRLMAYSRAAKDVPPAVLRFTCRDRASDSFLTPPLEELLKKSLVVATLSTAAKLHLVGVPRGHFDLIAIDEAGQATEPEAVAPFGALLGAEGQLLLAGDPMQLGPVIHSTPAARHGLATSLLERLMRRPLYAPARAADGVPRFNPLVLTKLRRNFRSHETLLELPNALFYDRELICAASEELRYHCRGPEDYNCPPLSTRGLPLKFHGVEGDDQREGNSPSWFNSHECTLVLQYVQALLLVRQKPIKCTDIGVITPYNKQAEKIRKLLTVNNIKVGSDGIKVGSTELFQGQERKVMIISTVRSSVNHIGFDLKHRLGFVANPKRFNVATTRAQALMIIVGNPHVLVKDPHWGQLLRKCIELKVYEGTPPPELPEHEAGEDGDTDSDGSEDSEDNSLTKRLEAMLLTPSASIEQEGAEMPEWS